MENLPQATISPYDTRKREKTARMPVQNVDGGPGGVYVLELPRNGCRHIHGGSGAGLKLCGRPSLKTGITYLCEDHRQSYGVPR